MGPTVKLRSRASEVLGVLMVVASLVAVVSAARGGLDELLPVVAPIALFGLLGWAAFLRPHVEVSDGGVTVVNTLRSTEVPWPAVESVDGRYGLRLDTAYGPVTAWGAGAPAGRQRARGRPSATSLVVSDRLESLRVAGHLDQARLERPDLRRTWHWPVIAAGGLLVVAAVLLPVLV